MEGLVLVAGGPRLEFRAGVGAEVWDVAGVWVVRGGGDWNVNADVGGVGIGAKDVGEEMPGWKPNMEDWGGIVVGEKVVGEELFGWETKIDCGWTCSCLMLTPAALALSWGVGPGVGALLRG